MVQVMAGEGLMARLVEFEMQDGGSIVVEVDESVAGPELASTPGEIAGKAAQSFEQAAQRIKAIAGTVLSQVKELGPEAVSVELGIKFSAEAGAILAKTAGEGNCKITLSWKKS